ncbi:VanW family protein [Amycolatopsis saalfeldensis]|uniref:Vancomycin resistance protein YoaR, contains peptidoglycan-binding and VanW domains n=1 Tax=Amycolatopsis saalfeldensis TaxID=394193 RepID=A0A1H8YKX5_9PSEU|nr:VanW family protein [Amycolatopsis saalfeldensis]SEP52789.1 Vancomycin resistance protein YoaR, contains peptidoglycan-binding and VanW domains [Amycolatopsis saalfeldensis]
MPYEPRWPEPEGEQTVVLPVVMPGDVPPGPVPEPAPSRRHPRLRRAGWVAGGVFGVLLVAYLIDLLTSQGSVPRGVTVAGVDVGGLDRPVAERELRSLIEPRLTQPLTVTAGEARSTLSPTLAGLRLDWSATLDQAGDQPVNPFTRLSSFFTSHEIGVVSQAEADKLDPALEDLRGRVDHDAVEGTVRFEGATPVAVPPQAGQKLDVAAAKQAVLAGWASGRELALPVVPAPVRTTAEGVRTALEQFAKPAVATPVTIRGEGADATLQPKDIAAALSFEPADGGGLTPKIDPKKITDVAGPQLKASEKEGKEAAVAFSGGKPVVEPSVDGKAVDWEPSLKPLPDVLKRADQRELKAVYKNSPAKVTTEQANRLGVKEVVGEFTTGGFAADSGVNIKVVAQKVNGAIVKPGETFSLNGFTGPRGKPQGYVEAGVIENGAPAREVGGGISQFATTLYNASYFAGMKDAGHREHSYYISRYPAAREATVFQNPDGASVIDLKFTNDSDTGIAIQTIWSPSSLTVKLWGTKRYTVESVPGSRSSPTDPPTKPGPAENCHASNGAPGFTTTDTRVLKDVSSGREVSRHTRTVRYNPQPKITCGA